MKTFLLIAALSSGGFAAVGPLQAEAIPTEADAAHEHFQGHAQEDDIDTDGGFAAVELPEGASVSVPGEDHGDEVFLVSLLQGNEGADHLDLAGTQRTPAGRVVDAQPGSFDAAVSGMQHDLGNGTVRNTTSPDPTPSPILQEALAVRDVDPAQPAPQAQEPLEAASSGSGTGKK